MKQAIRKSVVQAFILWKTLKVKTYLALNLRRNNLIEFPRDDFPHKTQLEWWYFNSHLKDAEGNEYSAVGTIATSGDSYFAFLDKEQNVFAVKFAKGKFDAETISNGIYRWKHLGNFTYEVESTDPEFSLRILSNKKPMLVNNKGLGGVDTGYSYYVCLTNCSAEGELVHNGKKIIVKGIAWIDRQWGEMNLGLGVDWWEWFSIQLDNNIEIMVYWIKQRNGKEKQSIHIVSDQTVVQDCEIRTIQDWIVNGKNWGSKWGISSKGVEIECSVSMKEQFINEWNLEASGEAIGKIDGKKVQGKMFFEKLYFPPLF